jgi:oxygen-dependent protoporphyrinogen oxidase
MRVVVVGGGIAGLSAAEFVSRERPDVEVVVLEQSGRIGGKLQTAELAGVQVDVGAEALLARRPEGIQLLERIGATADRTDPLTTTASLYIDGTLRPVPSGTVLGIPGDAATLTGVLSPAGQVRVEGETGVDFPPLTDDVSVGGLVAQRLGQEVVDRIVDPLLAGVYAGRAEQLSLRATVPDLAAILSTEGGSLLAAAHRLAGRARAAANSSPVFTSLVGGLGRLPGLIAQRAPFTIRTGTAVRSIERSADGFLLHIGARPEDATIEATAVIVAVPATKAAGLVRGLTASAAAELGSVRTASMAIVSLAYPAGTAMPPGSGVLVPATSGQAVKAVTIFSQKWPGSDAIVRVRASLGRIGDEAVLQRDDSELATLATDGITAVLGVRTPPIASLVTRWGGGLPQYDVGHVERVVRIRDAVATVPGLAVAGATYDGIGIPACIRSARLAADQILPRLGPRPP